MTESSGDQADSAEADKRKGKVLEKTARWFDSRLGLSYEMLRPAPSYSINPFYWLGALAVVAFVIQGVTGILMMLYYVPSPAQAYSSTLYIVNNVSYGSFLETVHLYTAYAMIMLTFMHLMRGYFVSVHKKPREMMWVIGMLMGFVTLGFGFTGYLLPWTVVSYSATHVGLGMIQALPPVVSSFLTFLVVGGGEDAMVLLRFYDLHVVVLPAILLVLLAAKMYMLEAHGVSEPVTGLPPSKERTKPIPIFPDVSFYLFELAALFGTAMLLISVIFPLNFPPEYSAASAGQYVAQPDWYFLWIYQMIKISAFEEAGLPFALAAVTLIFIVFFLLPFADRGTTRAIMKRTKYVTLGVVFVAEVAVLTVWGYLTPGQVIPNEQAALVLGGTALLTALGSLAIYRLLMGGLRKAKLGSASLRPKALSFPLTIAQKSSAVWTIGSFVGLVLVGTLSISGALSTTAAMVAQGLTSSLILSLALSLVGLSVSVLGTCYLLYRLDLPNGRIKRRIRTFEVGWND